MQQQPSKPDVTSDPGDPGRSGDAVLPIRAEKLVIRRDGRTLVDHVDLKIGPAHGVSVVLGPNGAGKSLLLRLLANLMPPDAGTVTWAGAAPSSELAHRIGFLFQRPVMLRRSALANIEFALATRGMARPLRREQGLAALDAARLAHLADRPALSLSGGEQQRLALVRALALSPEVLFLDEPTANLDPASTAALEEMVVAAAATTPVVLVTHDLAGARRVATRVLFMHHGRILERTRHDVFFDRPQTPEARTFLAGKILI